MFKKEEIVERLKMVMQAQPASASTFAQILGVSYGTLLGLLKGNRRPSYATLMKIGGWLDRNEDLMLGRSKE